MSPSTWSNKDTSKVEAVVNDPMVNGFSLCEFRDLFFVSERSDRVLKDSSGVVRTQRWGLIRLLSHFFRRQC